jgi:uncharacterized protein YchJ
VPAAAAIISNNTQQHCCRLRTAAAAGGARQASKRASTPAQAGGAGGFGTSKPAQKQQKQQQQQAQKPATARKGFGDAPQQLPAERCPCGSGNTYKACCKLQHVSAASSAPSTASVEQTVRARFSAIVKKDVGYLLRTTHPDFHRAHYGGDPGASGPQLQADLQHTVEHYAYSGLKLREVRVGALAAVAVGLCVWGGGGGGGGASKNAGGAVGAP